MDTVTDASGTTKELERMSIIDDAWAAEPQPELTNSQPQEIEEATDSGHHEPQKDRQVEELHDLSNYEDSSYSGMDTVECTFSFSGQPFLK